MKHGDRLEKQRTDVQGLLADVEAELKHADAADDQLGTHADDALGKINAELAKRRKGLGPGDGSDAEAEYLHLLGHRRRAHLVGAMAAQAKARR